MTYSAEVLADNPLFYGRLGEASGTTMADASGNGRNGTYTGVTLGVAGALVGDADTAVTTAGNSGSVGDIAHAAWMDVSTAVTLEAWVKWTGTPGTSMFWSRAGGTNYNCGLFVNGASIGFGVKTIGTSNSALTTGGTFNDGNWHHVVGTFDGSNVRLYVDGTHRVTVANSGSVHSATNGLQVGGRGANYFAGSVDEAAYYGTVLSATRIAAHYTAGTTSGGTDVTLAGVVPAVTGDFHADVAVDPTGSWSWWTRPRAVAIDGKVYIGSTTQANQIIVDEYVAATGGLLHRHVVKTGATFDDHNNPALIIEAGQPPIVMWQRHAADSFLRYTVGTQPIESGFTAGTEQTITLPAAVTYSAAHVVGGTIYVVTRSGATAWRLISSTNWGTSWSSAKTIVTHTHQMYVASVLADDGRLRFAATTHPREASGQSVYYAELDLATDVLYDRAGNVLGSIGGSAPAMTAWDLAAAPTSGYKTWVYDVSAGANREIVWAQMDSASTPAITEYHHTTDAGGAWVSHKIVDAGVPFGIPATPDNGGNYLGGVQFVSPGVVLTAREASGTWLVERQATTDDGATWAPTEVTGATLTRLARAWPVEARDATAADWVAVNDITPPFTSYTSHESRIRLYAALIPDPSVTLSGTVSPVTGAFDVVGGLEVTLAGEVPPITGAFTLVSDGTDISLAGVVGPVTGSFTLDSPPQTFQTLGNARRRGAIAYATWEPPVVQPPVLPLVVHDKIKARAYTSVTITDGAQPAINAPLRAEADRAQTRILVGGRDITYWRGDPTPPPTYSLVSPLGYGSGVLELPQVHAAFETPGVGALSWLKPWAPVKVQRVLDGVVVATDYRGFLFDPQTRGRTLTFGLVGQATGQAAVDYRPPRVFRTRADLGNWWNQLLRKMDVRRGPRVDTGIIVQNRGDMDLLAYAQELSAQGINRNGAQWTVMPDSSGVYNLARKDTTTVHGTVYFDDQGAIADLRRDPAEEFNTVYATGLNREGRRIRFINAPGLQLRERVAFPGFMSQGDTGDGVVALVSRLYQVGYLSYEDRPGDYDADVTRAVRDLQDDADLPETGDVNAATWEALFDFSVTGYNIRGAHILPAAQKRSLRYRRRTPSGAILGSNPHYRRGDKVVAKAIDVGVGFNSQQVRNFAKMEIQEGSTPNWTGTIRFELGGYITGEHVPGTPITGRVGDARALRPGMNLWAPLFGGTAENPGTLFHVGGLEVDRGDNGRPVVTASVDTRARDTMEVWEVIARNRESRRSPARQWMRDWRSSILNKDGVIESDTLGGIAPETDLIGGRWNVLPVPMGQEGTVARMKLRLVAPTEYVVAVFGRRVGPKLLAGRIGNPLTKAGSEKWTDEGVLNDLRLDRVLLYVAGDDEDPCGYFPKRKSAGGEFLEVTGRWEDDAGFGYRTFDDYVLWVAIYPAANTTLQGGRVMFNQLESGT